MRHNRPHPSWSQLAHKSVQILRRGREKKFSFFHYISSILSIECLCRRMHRYATIAGEVDLSTAGQAWVVERLRSHNKQWRGFLWEGGGVD